MPQDVSELYGFAQPTAYLGEYNRWRQLFESNLARLSTSLPVRVDAVQPGGIGPVGLVDITVLVSQVTGDGRTVPGVSVPNVPYSRLQGGSNAVIIDPQPGDIGMALFCSRDISAVKNARDAAPPGSARMYDPSDAVYLGGILNGAPTQYIQFTEGGILVHSANSVYLGDTAATVRKLVDERMVQLFNDHTHTSTTPGTPTSAPNQTMGAGQLTTLTKAN